MRRVLAGQQRELLGQGLHTVPGHVQQVHHDEHVDGDDNNAYHHVHLELVNHANKHDHLVDNFDLVPVDRA